MIEALSIARIVELSNLQSLEITKKKIWNFRNIIAGTQWPVMHAFVHYYYYLMTISICTLWSTNLTAFRVAS